MKYRLAFAFYPIAIGLLFLSVFRLIFYFTLQSAFKELSPSDLLWAFVYGLRFDGTVLFFLYGVFNLLLFLPFRWVQGVVFRWVLSIWQLLVFVLLVVIAVVDLRYFPEVDRHLSFEMKLLATDKMSMFNMAWRSYPFTLFFGLLALTLLSTGYIWGLHWVLRHCPPAKPKLPLWQKANFIKMGKLFGVAFLYLFVSVLVGRGGWQPKPLSPRDAFFSNNLMAGQLVLNAPFTVLHALDDGSKLSRLSWLPGDQALRLSRALLTTGEQQNFPDPSLPLFRNREANGQPKKYNVILLMVESFGKFLLAVKTPSGETLLPFTHQLIQKSLYFPRFFSNGTRSIEGIASVFSCVNTIPHEVFVYTPYQQNHIFQSGKVLRSFGYSTLFLHGAFYGSLNAHQYVKSLGFEKVLSMDDFPNHAHQTDGSWGIMDNFTFPRFAQEIGQMQQPFFAGMFTLSTHEPFVIHNPDATVFPESARMGQFYNTFRQFDIDLRAFFELIQNQPWFQNTIVVITGDHSKARDTFIDRAQIPLILYSPNPPWKVGENDAIGQQTDILPSLFDLLDLPVTHPCAGNSVFSRPRRGFAYLNLDFPYWVEGDQVFRFDDEGNLKGAYKWAEDPNLSMPLKDYDKTSIDDYHAWMETNNHMLLDNKIMPP